MIIKKIIKKIKTKWRKVRLAPIRVFCLHHVCEKFDAQSMYSCDWMDLSVFKSKTIDLQKQGYQFIGLSEAYKHLKEDSIRTKKYAVLTFDDGYKSLLEFLPWLEEQNISATLFINGKYLDGESYRETPEEQYLTYEELFALTSPLIEVGHHGWEHKSVHHMDKKEFENSIECNLEILSKHPRYIPFWAYTWGQNNNMSNSMLHLYNMTPLVMTGGKNYIFNGFIDRELL